MVLMVLLGQRLYVSQELIKEKKKISILLFSFKTNRSFTDTLNFQQSRNN